MKRFLKWFFILLIILIILLAGAIISIPYLINPNEYKQEIIGLIKPHMKGRDLKIPGDIKISVLPWTGVQLGEIIIGNAEGFILKPFMTVAGANLRIDPWSLLSGEPEVSTLELIDVTIYLQRDAEGRNNWSDLAAAEHKSVPNSGFIRVSNAAPTATTPPPQTPGNTASLPKFKINAVRLANASVIFDDKQTKDVITLSKFNIDAGPIHNFEPIPIQGKYSIHSQQQDMIAASAFATTLTATAQFDDFVFSNFTLNTNISAKSLSDKLIKTSFTVPQLTINTSKQDISIKPFTLKIDDMVSTGRFTLKRFDTPVIRLGLEMKTLDLDRFLPKQESDTKEPTETTKSTPKPGDADYVPTVDDILAGKDKKEVVDESARLFAPLTVFGGSDAQGTIKIDQLKVKNLDIKNFKITLLARSGLVSAMFSAKLYEGDYEGDVQINTKRTPARLSSRQKLRDLQAGPVLLALTGKDTVKGRLNYQGQLYSSGETQNAITANLSGDGQFNLKDVTVRTVDVKRLALKENYDKLTFVQDKDENKEITAFDTIRGTLRIKEGVVYNKDLLGTSRRTVVKGDGYANLVDQTVNYTTTLISQKPLGFSMGNSTFDLKNKAILTHFTGPWSNIDVSNDLAKVLKEQFKQSELYQQKRAVEEDVKSFVDQETKKLEEKFRKKLKF